MSVLFISSLSGTIKLVDGLRLSPEESIRPLAHVGVEELFFSLIKPATGLKVSISEESYITIILSNIMRSCESYIPCLKFLLKRTTFKGTLGFILKGLYCT